VCCPLLIRRCLQEYDLSNTPRFLSGAIGLSNMAFVSFDVWRISPSLVIGRTNFLTICYVRAAPLLLYSGTQDLVRLKKNLTPAVGMFVIKIRLSVVICTIEINVKGKVFPVLIWAPNHYYVWESGGIAPRILKPPALDEGEW